ncbi:MAG: hypothetical protein WDZ48_11270, partial [Pirellulales bacterium]
MSTAPAAHSDRDPQLLQLVSEYVPAWLASLVVHLSLVLLLAMVQVMGGSSWQDGGVVLNVETSSGSGPDEDGMLAASIEVPSTLEQNPAVESIPAELTEVQPQPDATSKIDLVDPAAKLGSLIGSPIGSPTGGGLDGDDADGPAASARTAVFGLAAEGETFVYVFDRSESMNSTLTYTSEGTTVFSVTPLQAAKAELLRSLGDLDRGQRFHIVFYNHEVWMFDAGRAGNNRLLPASRENKRKAGNFVYSVYGDGNTQHVKPLEIALRLKPDVIFLLTDGEEKDDPTEAQLARLTKLNDGRTRINVIQFCYTTRTDGMLVRLANDNGGRHMFFNITRLGPGMAAAKPGAMDQNALDKSVLDNTMTNKETV